MFMFVVCIVWCAYMHMCVCRPSLLDCSLCVFIIRRHTSSEVQLNRKELYQAPFLAGPDGCVPEPSQLQLQGVRGSWHGGEAYYYWYLPIHSVCVCVIVCVCPCV